MSIKSSTLCIDISFPAMETKFYSRRRSNAEKEERKAAKALEKLVDIVPDDTTIVEHEAICQGVFKRRTHIPEVVPSRLLPEIKAVTALLLINKGIEYCTDRIKMLKKNKKVKAEDRRRRAVFFMNKIQLLELL